MMKFSELTTKERYSLGQALGDKLLGTASYPEAEIENFLEAREIEPDIDPLDEANFLNGLDDTAMMCESCNWYCPPDTLNEWSCCDDCADYDDGYGEEE
jgi:hypothetical protein